MSRPVSPKVQAAMDEAISPEARALLVELLRWQRHLDNHHTLYLDVVHGAAGKIHDEARAAVREDRPIPVNGAAHAIFEIFEEAAKGTPSELRRDSE